MRACSVGMCLAVCVCVYVSVFGVRICACLCVCACAFVRAGMIFVRVCVVCFRVFGVEVTVWSPRTVCVYRESVSV